MASQEPKQQNRLIGEFLREAVYDGQPGQTHAESLHYSCACGAIFPLKVLRAVNVATNRELAEAAVAGNLNRGLCAQCKRKVQIEIPYILHHPSEERFVLVIPENLRHQELELRVEVLKDLSSASSSAVPPYVSDFQVVFGTEGLRLSLSRPAGHVAIRQDLAKRQAELEERERKTTEQERVFGMREAQLDEKERAVEQQEESVMMREERLKERGENVTHMEDELRQREAGYQARIEALEVRAQMLDQREAELAKRDQAYAVQNQSLSEWDTQRQSPIPGGPGGVGELGGAVAPPAAQAYVSPHSGAVNISEGSGGIADAEQDFVSSLMRDPEHEEPSSVATQRSRSMTSAQAARVVGNASTVEALIEDEDVEELSADDLIESETGLHATPVDPKLRPPQPASTPLPVSSFDSTIPHSGEGALLMIPGLEKSPPVAPPPAGLAQRNASAQPIPTLSESSSFPPSELPVPSAKLIEGAGPSDGNEPLTILDKTTEEPQTLVTVSPAPPDGDPKKKPAGRPFLEPPQHWKDSDKSTTYELLGDDIYLLVRTDEEVAEKIRSGKPDLWVQLHQLPTYPLITFSLVLEPEADDLKALFWILDIDEGNDRKLLMQLRRRFRTKVLLYDMNYDLIDEVTFEPPREVNVARVVELAMQQLEEIAPASISPVQARAQFEEDWDWAGKKRHPFTEDAYSRISDVLEAKIALGILNYWSESKNHEYLVLTKSVPVDLLDTITRRILDGAIRFGLWLPQSLKERAVALALAGDIQELIARLVDSFSSLGAEPKGLELSDVAENWQRLLRDAEEFDVPVSKDTTKLAESIIDQANASEEREEKEIEPLDLESLDELSDTELLSLLERRVARKKAALELASRKKEIHLEALFRAARKMGRPDLVPVIPALLAFGESAGDYFVEGLTSRKSFTRQACAIGLGELKLRRAVVPLLHQLIAEKTPVWNEIARALGRYGPTGIKPLHRYLRDPKGKEDRLVRTMAFFAVNGAAENVEEIVSNTDPNIAALGSQALDMRDEAQAVEEQVQGEGEIEEQTPLLRFSRRLCEAIAGKDQRGDHELLEELGDSDIMELEEGEE